MPYQPSVQSSISLATTGVVGPNLNNTVFAAAHMYFTERLRPYSSIEEVKADADIPSTSTVYAAALRYFSQTGPSTPLYIGRREADDVTLTPSPVANSAEYGLTFIVRDDATNTPVTTVVSVTSDSDATAAEIATALTTAINTGVPVANVTATDNTGSLTVAPDAGYSFTTTSVVKLTDAYTTTESAADLLTAIQEEDNQNWYFFTCEDKSEAFILAMAAEIEATGSSDYPKQYHVSIAEADSLVVLPDPAVDTLGKLKEGNYDRTAGYWYHEDDYLQELVSLGQNSQYVGGTTTWKFLQDVSARDLVTGKKLSTSKQGYLADRNATWYGQEYNIDFSHGGTMASGEWIDVIRGADYINSRIETELLQLLLNRPGGKIAFTPAGRLQVQGVVNGVLSAAVGLGILVDFVPCSIPETASFLDQSQRILRDVKFTGYLAGAVHFIIVNGVLTYQDEPLS